MRCGCTLLLCSLLALSGAELVFQTPGVLVRHEPAPPRPVGTGLHRRNDVKRAAAHKRGPAAPDDEGLQYEEYFVEHEISAVDARVAADALNTSIMPDSAPGCGVCTREEIAYCEWQVVADHCCCERRFQEPYHWIPHTCYAGPHQCRPIARDCGFYRRLRDCCCDKKLAEKWKSILSSSQQNVPTAVVFLAYLVSLLWI